MFGLFNRKPKPLGRAAKAWADKFIGPPAMAVAVAQVAAEHVAAVKAGTAEYPIHESESAPVLTVWHHVRLEAFARSLGFGDGSLVDLADVGKQPEVLAEFLERKAHLQMPQPSGTPTAQSVQSMWQVYLYLSDVGTALCDPMTDRPTLRLAGRTILSDLEGEAATAREGWSAVMRGEAGDGLPPTLFELFFADVNRKTKSIAFAKAWGPFYEREFPQFIQEVRDGADSDEDAARVCRVMAALVEATNPDDARERVADV